MYGRGLADPGSFWLEQAKRLDWIKRPEIAGDWSFDEQDFHISWFRDGMLNVAANCLDRHLEKNGETVALIWEPDDRSEEHTSELQSLMRISYAVFCLKKKRKHITKNKYIRHTIN